MNEVNLADILKPPVDRTKLVSIIRNFSTLSPFIQASACIFIMTMAQEQLDKLSSLIAEIIKMEPEQRSLVMSELVDKLNLPAELKGVITQYAADITKIQ